jgi:hypothetical protein
MLTIYKHVVIQDYKGPPDPHEIDAVETELGTTLPDGYRQFLEIANGGTLEYCIRVPATADGEEMMFCDLFYPGKDRHGGYGDGTLIGEIQNHRRFISIPKSVLPFARDGGDSTLYLDLTEDGQGRVIAFVLGLPAWTGLRQESGFVEVASSFDDYISRLYLDDEYIEESLTLLRKAVLEEDENKAQANREFLDLAVPDWQARFPDLTAQSAE